MYACGDNKNFSNNANNPMRCIHKSRMKKLPSNIGETDDREIMGKPPKQGWTKKNCWTWKLLAVLVLEVRMDGERALPTITLGGRSKLEGGQVLR